MSFITYIRERFCNTDFHVEPHSVKNHILVEKVVHIDLSSRKPGGCKSTLKDHNFTKLIADFYQQDQQPMMDLRIAYWDCEKSQFNHSFKIDISDVQKANEYLCGVFDHLPSGVQVFILQKVKDMQMALGEYLSGKCLLFSYQMEEWVFNDEDEFQLYADTLEKRIKILDRNAEVTSEFLRQAYNDHLSHDQAFKEWFDV
jgi:hypothetical protein